MLQILEHIDKIARDKKRDVLFVTFDQHLNESDAMNYFLYDYEQDQVRKEFIIWLDGNNIPYQECGPIVSENGWESYRGQVYIDIPMDEQNLKYQFLNEHFENEDGSMKIESIGYSHLSYKVAMKNAHHDEPGFWDKRAEEF